MVPQRDVTAHPRASAPRVYVTGGSGFLGTSVVAALAGLLADGTVALVVSGDLRVPADRIDGVVYERADVTHANDLLEQFQRHRITTVVHLAAIVTPGPGSAREDVYRVDVEGSRNVLNACIATGVGRLVVSSSGAVYGYHADTPKRIVETTPLRGNESYAYSHHKWLVELMLEDARVWHPQLEQVVFRIGTILGRAVQNHITTVLEGSRVLTIAGADSPFVFAWDEDVVACMVRGATVGPPGVYNVAGDGALTLREVARILGKPRLVVPARLLKAVLWVGSRLNLTGIGPEQVKFLQYRPVLVNTRLKQQFGYTPRKSSREALEAWHASRHSRSQPRALN